MSELKYRPISPMCLHLSQEEQCNYIKSDDPFLSMESRHVDDCDSSDDEFDLKNFKTERIDQMHSPNNAHQVGHFPNKHLIKGGNSQDNSLTTQEVYREAIVKAAANGTYTVNVPVAEAWIKEHFQYQNRMSVARAAVYDIYLQHCRTHNVPSCNPATFGKVIRNVFPSIKTRRIGNRGQSKYHYYGIGPTEKARGLISCAYGRRLNRHCFGEFHKPENRSLEEVKVNTEVKDVTQGVERELYRHILSNFPYQAAENFPARLKQRMEDFLFLYRNHNRDVLTALSKAEFEKVTCYTTEFWQSLPLTFAREDFAGCPEVVQLILACDQRVYNAMREILVPDKQMTYDPKLMEYVEQFITCLDTSLELSMTTLPVYLQLSKISACRSFQRQTRRELQYCHLFSSCRAILQNPDAVKAMLSDIQAIQIDSIVAECSCLITKPLTKTLLCKYLGQIQNMLLNNYPLEEYLELAEKIIKDNLNHVQIHQNLEAGFRVKNLVLEWSYIAGNIIKQLSLAMAESLGSFHLLDVFLREHLLSTFSKIY